MDYLELVNATCPIGIATEIRTIGSDLSAGDKLWEIAPTLDPECGSNVLALLSSKVDAGTDPLFLSAYFSEAVRLSASNTPAIRQLVGDAASRVEITQHPDLARSYFSALIANNIDIRPVLIQKNIPMLSGNEFRSLPWQYHLYLVALDTPHAIQMIERHLLTVQNGNDATNLLTSLANIRKPDVRRVLQSYSDDTRHADGPSGPGATISQTVTALLEGYAWGE